MKKSRIYLPLPSTNILPAGDMHPLETGNTKAGLWNPDKNPPILCESAGILHIRIHDLLHQWNDHSPTNTHVISLDGVSGSGKSSLLQCISTAVKHMPGVSIHPIGVDGFIATPRSSPLRLLMLESRELFWKLIYNRQSLIDTLAGIVQADGKQCSIPVSHHYNRSNGTVGPAILNIPEGRKIVMVDGIDSTQVLQSLEKIAPSPQTRIMVVAPPNTALQRAAKRDARQGRRSVAEAKRLRGKEFAFLVPRICGQNINNVDLIYAPEGIRA